MVDLRYVLSHLNAVALTHSAFIDENPITRAEAGKVSLDSLHAWTRLL